MASEQNYSVEQTMWHDEPALVLRDQQAGAEALLVPGLGANCVAWAITHDGQRLEVLETPPTAEDLRTRKFRAGIPVLWPFPGRVREATYTSGDQEYHLPRTDKGGVHHIHGVVNMAGWRIANQEATPDGARVVLSIGPEDIADDMRAGYPFNFALSLEFTLSGRRLIIDTFVNNKNPDQPLPFSYGLHPYFRAPLVKSETTPDRTACDVLIPAASRWPTHEGLPTAAPQPLIPDKDFRQWRPLGSQPFDDMYTGVSYDGDWTTAGYRDPGANLEVRIQADHNFREWVLFTQPNRPSLCIEPYTAPPNAINFEREGLANSGLTVLPPGEIWTARVIMEVAGY